jgi:hypothetical protein
VTYVPRGVLYQLTDAEVVEARLVGDGRNLANRNSKDKSYYHREKMEDDTVASFAAATAECAVARVFNAEWHAKVWPAGEHHLHSDEPDVGENIEVKRVRNPDAGLVVREKDRTLGRYVVLAYPIPETGYTQVDVIGWIRADKGWQVGRDSGEGYVRVPQKYLRSVPKEGSND